MSIRDSPLNRSSNPLRQIISRPHRPLPSRRSNSDMIQEGPRVAGSLPGSSLVNVLQARDENNSGQASR
jgi:hypothetical protein